MESIWGGCPAGLEGSASAARQSSQQSIVREIADQVLASSPPVEKSAGIAASNKTMKEKTALPQCQYDFTRLKILNEQATISTSS